MGASDSALMDAMRIKSIDTLKRYTGDARTKRDTMEAQGIGYKYIIDT
jgi:hypothetical protein